jgi:hypothetical protein
MQFSRPRFSLDRNKPTRRPTSVDVSSASSSSAPVRRVYVPPGKPQQTATPVEQEKPIPPSPSSIGVRRSYALQSKTPVIVETMSEDFIPPPPSRPPQRSYQTTSSSSNLSEGKMKIR